MIHEEETNAMTAKETDPNGSEPDAYEPPELVKYGDMEDLTSGIGTGESDGLTGSQLM